MKNNHNLDAEASLLSELLLVHSALGRGYVSPFPAARGMVFTSALPSSSMGTFKEAESKFRLAHNEQNAQIKEQLASMEAKLKGFLKSNPFDSPDPTLVKSINELKESAGSFQSVTWKAENTSKSTLVELLKRSTYGAFTYVDQVGSRLSASMCASARLADDFSWVTLTEGTTDEALIRSNNTGGALIYTLNGESSAFNHFCSCHHSTAEKLIDRVNTTTSGSVIAGSAVIIPTRKVRKAYVTEPRKILSLMDRVFVRGKDPVEDRIKVTIHPDCREEWDKMMSWGVEDLADREGGLTDNQVFSCEDAPASAEVCVLFGSRAAMTLAFLELMTGDTCPPSIELNKYHLEAAKKFARVIFELSSGLHLLENRAANAVKATEAFWSEAKMEGALAAALKLAGDRGGKFSRGAIRATPGLTNGLVDRLVERGQLVEMVGVAQCQIGNATRAYSVATEPEPLSAEEAVSEYEEAAESHAEEPSLISPTDAYKVYCVIKEKAEQFDSDGSYLPLIPLHMLTPEEIKHVPRLMETHGEELELRGGPFADEIESITSDPDCPANHGGINLWVRRRRDGSEARNWVNADALGFANTWGETCKH